MVKKRGFKTSQFGHDRKKFWGKYRGIVTNNSDPEERGRIKVIVPKVFGKELELPWALPCVSSAGEGFGAENIPNENDGVWVEFENGEAEKPIWVGFWWADEEFDFEDMLKEFDYEEDVQYLRRFSTTGGYKFTIFEREGEEYFHIVTPEGNELIIDDEEKYTEYKTIEGQKLRIDDDQEFIEFEDIHGNKIRTEKDGIILDTIDEVLLGSSGSPHPVPLGDLLLDWLDNHQHIGNLGSPTSPAQAVIPTDNSLISDVSFTD